MIDHRTLVAILAMASVTYMTRIGGYLLLGNRHLSPRTMATLERAPGCVLIAVITPAFLSGRLADLLALGVTLVAAARLPLLPTVLLGVATAGLARYALG
ncbi:AzlD family protein [Acidisoma sp. 7E03]